MLKCPVGIAKELKSRAVATGRSCVVQLRTP
jgi:hypothetical protein